MHNRLAEEIDSVKSSLVAALREIISNARSASRTSPSHEPNRMRDAEQFQQDADLKENWLETALQQIIDFVTRLQRHAALPVMEVLAEYEMVSTHKESVVREEKNSLMKQTVVSEVPRL